ncbi:MAG: TerB family tellurite resistance protein [Deltaproteobacteria bacterium]|nr:TerB family tellurite resistance protein [Deltaproteobacteria bacterium]NND28475.1 tellurite resistance TerB family protein [Myxococcales bacterium]MBT8466089.1 TerB family tellurite resistance protein [Deltaproteobacteria bacterium]MBT8481526.1 TerB family tellurite resistance protein [Deltaproteobacteria bacterium]NNK06178.1 tellurite resistance TerB family protein [Myxococcales bacterium]
MIPDETVAYAIATWARFNEDVTDVLLRALSGAFALVAASDGELAPSEADGFVDMLRGKANVFSGLHFDELESTFRELTEALMADPEDGRRRAIECIKRVAGDPVRSELVRSAAAMAVASDGRVRASEEASLQEISKALSLANDG